jgi:SSS family transporter
VTTTVIGSQAGVASNSGLLLGDWLVLGGYFALLAGVGWWFSRRGARTSREYFLGTRAMPAWAVAVSILATAQSAATFVGVPASSYRNDLSYLVANLGGIIAAVVLARVFIPAYYRAGVTTPYELLEARFGPGARTGAAVAYLLGRVLASGARVFVGALPVSLLLFGDTRADHVALAVCAFIVFGVLFTFLGGVSSVIWTDLVQVAVYLGAAVAAVVVLWVRIDLPAAEVLSVLRGPPDKLAVVSLSTSPAVEFTLFTALTGFVLLTLASHGTDQDLVQRMLTCGSAAKGAWSVVGGVLVGVPAVLLFLLLGLLLHVFYSKAGGTAPEPKDVFQAFALTEMRGGLAGLFLAGLCAAGPAGINSGLNSMASTFVSDIYKRLRPGRDDAAYLRVGRLGVVGAGVALGACALLCIPWQRATGSQLLSFVLSVMTFAYAGLLGVFLTALFTRRGDSVSAVMALAAGPATVVLFQPFVYARWSGVLPESWRAEAVNYTWALCVGTVVATVVCCSRPGKAGRGRSGDQVRGGRC